MESPFHLSAARAHSTYHNRLSAQKAKKSVVYFRVDLKVTKRQVDTVLLTHLSCPFILCTGHLSLHAHCERSTDTLPLNLNPQHKIVLNLDHEIIQHGWLFCCACEKGLTFTTTWALSQTRRQRCVRQFA